MATLTTLRNNEKELLYDEVVPGLFGDQMNYPLSK